MHHQTSVWHARALPACTGGIPAECRPPPEAYNLLARMLAYDPAQRISAEEALGHEYFTRGPRPSANVFAPPVSVCVYVG